MQGNYLPYCGWKDELRRTNEKDEWILQIIQKVISQTTDTYTSLNNQLPKFQFENGFLKYSSRIVVSPTSPWRSKIFEKHHCTQMGGHEVY